MAVGQATSPAARVSTPAGLVVGIPEGSRLVFGRGPDADLTIAAGRGLSRRAGVISALGDGVALQAFRFEPLVNLVLEPSCTAGR